MINKNPFFLEPSLISKLKQDFDRNDYAAFSHRINKNNYIKLDPEITLFYYTLNKIYSIKLEHKQDSLNHNKTNQQNLKKTKNKTSLILEQTKFLDLIVSCAKNNSLILKSNNFNKLIKDVDEGILSPDVFSYFITKFKKELFKLKINFFCSFYNCDIYNANLIFFLIKTKYSKSLNEYLLLEPNLDVDMKIDNKDSSALHVVSHTPLTYAKEIDHNLYQILSDFYKVAGDKKMLNNIGISRNNYHEGDKIVKV